MIFFATELMKIMSLVKNIRTSDTHQLFKLSSAGKHMRLDSALYSLRIRSIGTMKYTISWFRLARATNECVHRALFTGHLSSLNEQDSFFANWPISLPIESLTEGH